MRIIINECKKILDIRIILLLCMFSILYYMTFTQIYRYPTGGQLTNTKYDIPFTAELVKEWGPKWKVKDEKQYQEKHQELERGFAKIIKQDQELSKNRNSQVLWNGLKRLKTNCLKMQLEICKIKSMKL